MMQPYETSATVDQHGELHLAGLPFAVGTPVEVVVSLKSAGATGSEVDRTARLLAALDKGRNVQPLGRLNREELYDRDVLH